eukprot:3571535-Prorocentrum_lima.AAC.1
MQSSSGVVSAAGTSSAASAAIASPYAGAWFLIYALYRLAVFPRRSRQAPEEVPVLHQQAVL